MRIIKKLFLFSAILWVVICFTGCNSKNQANIVDEDDYSISFSFEAEKDYGEISVFFEIDCRYQYFSDELLGHDTKEKLIIRTDFQSTGEDKKDVRKNDILYFHIWKQYTKDVFKYLKFSIRAIILYNVEMLAVYTQRVNINALTDTRLSLDQQFVYLIK